MLSLFSSSANSTLETGKEMTFPPVSYTHLDVYKRQKSKSYQHLRQTILVYIFDLCCRKIRLSSFILNKDSPTERGHVIYRNIFYKLFYSNRAKMSNLELYSQPKSLEESKRLFKQNPHIHAYFVPDGNMMRVPSNDIISKKYVQFLFVPVTKDDKLLQPLDIDRIQKRQKLNAGEFGYLENQSTEFDEYKVVYVPPHFTLTYSLLIVFIWLFASILIIGVLLAANICGLPVTAFIQFTLHYFQLSKACLLYTSRCV